MVRRIIVLLAVVAASLVGTATSFASTPTINAQDQAFLIEAHQGNLAEIKASRLAERQGSKKAVREAGARLIRDHTKLDKEVKRVAHQVGVKLPRTPTEKQKAELKQLSAKRGAEFDRAWVTSMIADHRADLAAGAKEESSGSSEEVKKVARDAKPVIEEHLKLLESIHVG